MEEEELVDVRLPGFLHARFPALNDGLDVHNLLGKVQREIVLPAPVELPKCLVRILQHLHDLEVQHFSKPTVPRRDPFPGFVHQVLHTHAYIFVGGSQSIRITVDDDPTTAHDISLPPDHVLLLGGYSELCCQRLVATRQRKVHGRAACGRPRLHVTFCLKQCLDDVIVPEGCRFMQRGAAARGIQCSRVDRGRPRQQDLNACQMTLLSRHMQGRLLAAVQQVGADQAIQSSLDAQGVPKLRGQVQRCLAVRLSCFAACPVLEQRPRRCLTSAGRCHVKGCPAGFVCHVMPDARCLQKGLNTLCLAIRLHVRRVVQHGVPQNILLSRGLCRIVRDQFSDQKSIAFLNRFEDATRVTRGTSTASHCARWRRWPAKGAPLCV
mmetsp:Transcript_77237/g.213612  ORF Transcript_77237/g.213612 Transcript_77237/m.213612 type:complete len:380 (-) Transcript_77237:54-1193(-)